MRLHDAEGVHPSAELFDCGGTMTQDIVSSEHGVFFFQDEAHVIIRMAGGMYGTNGGAFDAEDLPVGNGLLTSAGRVLVYGLAEVGIEAEKVGDAAGVVAVPVGEQNVRKLCVGGGEPGGDQVGPLRNALTGVDENPSRAGSYNIGVCALKCELVLSLPVSSC